MRRGFPLLPPDVKRVSRFRFARHSPRRRRSLGLPSACTGDLPADLSELLSRGGAVGAFRWWGLPSFAVFGVHL
ncbi:hypothetical protein VZT92_011759 [Zoarces viviparus]|uniref:Uncharacterized protein n=1 Tax=Zoarces viviparus TaxID=48416 RepID=A0AAW1F6P8_ZOAVI